MSLKPELLPGLPPYAGGKTSINVYNAGGGLYDERTIDANLPMPIEDGSVMPIGAFKTLVNSLLKTYGGRWERCPETILSAKIFCRYVYDTVSVNIEGNFDLRNSTRCRRNTCKVELT